MKTGTVYKIIHTQSDIVYVGSTFEKRISDRWSSHKGGFKKYLNNKGSCVSIYPYFKQYGIENFKIILINKYKCCDRKHLQAYEQLWMNKLRCINKVKAFQPLYKLRDKQYYEDNKDKIKQRHKQYHKNNKDKIKQKKKQYHKNNKDKLKKNREDNKDKIKQKEKQYYEDNKDKIKQQRKKRYLFNNQCKEFRNITL